MALNLDWTPLASGTTAGQAVGCVDGTSVDHGASSMVGVSAAMAPLLEEVRSSWFNVEQRDQTAIVAVLTRTPSPAADYGLLFVTAAGQIGGCGEATMFAAATAPRDPGTSLTVDTASGRIRSSESDRGAIALTMPPLSRSRGRPVTIGSMTRTVRLVSVAGNTFVSLSAASAGLDVECEPDILRRAGDALLRHLADQFEADDVLRPGLLLLTEPVVDRATRSAVIWDGILNRGPCGTGTCARFALALEDGEIDSNDTLTHLSPFQESFLARVDPEGDPAKGLAITIEGQVVVSEECAAPDGGRLT